VSSTSSSGSSSAARQRSPGSPGDPADRGVAGPSPASGAAAAAAAAVLPGGNGALPAVPAQAPMALPVAPPAPALARAPEPGRVGTGVIWAFVEMFKQSTDSDQPAERIGAALRLWKIILGTLVWLGACAVVAVYEFAHSVHVPQSSAVRWVVGCMVGGASSIFGAMRLRRSLAGRRRLAAQARTQAPTQPVDPRRDGSDTDADSR